jgi:hypothetical protein
VAGLAGDRVCVQVEARVGVRFIGMTICAGNLLGWVNDIIICHHASLDDVVFRAVTVGALEIKFAHVHIEIFGGEVQALVEVAVFDAVSAAAVEVTFSAVVARGGAYRFRRGQQICTRRGIALKID